MEPLLAVHYLHESDVVLRLEAEGDAVTFGRDDECDLVIFSAINGTALSRIAGRIWRMEGELWLRNLSSKHELWLEIPGRPPMPPLPPRNLAYQDPGAALSIPGELAYVHGPDGCVLVVTQHRTRPTSPAASGGASTLSTPEVPDDLKPIAAALCEPLLDGHRLPASYEQVQRRVGLVSRRRVRDQVTRLCALYQAEVPELRERFEARRAVEERELGATARPIAVRGGITIFAANEHHGDAAPETERRRALALPDYYEVAHLLVRRELVTARDVAALPTSPI